MEYSRADIQLKIKDALKYYMNLFLIESYRFLSISLSVQK